MNNVDYTPYVQVVITNLQKLPQDWNFKSDPNYQYMLEHVNKQHADEYFRLIKSEFNMLYTYYKNEFIDIIHQNDVYGQPSLVHFHSFSCSGTNLRYLYHALLIIQHIQHLRLNDINFIEIGGGYGGLCFFIHKLCELFNIQINSYTIFDLDYIIDLQRLYLKQHKYNITTSTLEYLTQQNTFVPIRHDSFLISNYAFSEISQDLQDAYIDNIIEPYVTHGFMCWNRIPIYPFIKNNKNFIIESEKPLTGEFNWFIRF